MTAWHGGRVDKNEQSVSLTVFQCYTEKLREARWWGLNSLSYHQGLALQVSKKLSIKVDGEVTQVYQLLSFLPS